jgi:hypothetical protein
LSGKVGLSLSEKEFEPGIWLGEGAEIEKGARIEAPWSSVPDAVCAKGPW